ncbi:MAG TPA: 3-phosphoshikimate 1-carboxyvinyltransferase [Chitinophagaceae bacterium]|nr:3-phosphoshikimate 1-carboxyvinyltransferase [Chitinophagaceae bacterium]
MFVTIHPSNLSGTVHAPASKSSMQRACAAALLAKSKSIIHHPGHSDDDKAAIEIIEAMGALVEMGTAKLQIDSANSEPISRDINCHESGLSIRMFIPIVALSDKQITIKGEGSLKNRPMNFFDEALPQLGVKIKSNNGKVPIIIQGPLQPKNIEIDGSLSSQFLTGLLMAYAGVGASSVSIRVRNLTSKPYIDLTLDVMKKFGLPLPHNNNYEEFVFTPAQTPPPPNHGDSTHDSPLNGHDYTVEGDWSGGAFLLVAGAIAGPITIRGLDLMSTQADKAIINALIRANAAFAIEAKGIKIHPSEMKGFEFDATDCPDLFPPLVSLASYCKGETKIMGVNRLTHKESNRAVSLQQEFAKMGVDIEVHDDIMTIHGAKSLRRGAKVHSHHDHRIAMACAVAALKSNGETTIEEADAVKKSYPDFYEDLKSLGADVSLSSKIKFHE